MRNRLATTILRLLDRRRPVGDEWVADRELLLRFSRHGDAGAFATLVHRHGPMVHRVCRCLLSTGQDVEDAFQSTFVILARRSGAVAWQDSIGNWLHGVARRVSLKLRQQKGRVQGADPEPTQGPTAPATESTLAVEELVRVMQEEIAKLPPEEREPILLCHLGGQTVDMAACQLKISRRTLMRRLAEARLRLRERLERRGYGLPLVLLGGLLTSAAVSAAAPARLLRAAIQASVDGPARGAISLLASQVLAEMAGRKMLSSVAVTVAALVVGLLGASWGLGFLAVSGPIPHLAAFVRSDFSSSLDFEGELAMKKQSVQLGMEALEAREVPATLTGTFGAGAYAGTWNFDTVTKVANIEYTQASGISAKMYLGAQNGHVAITDYYSTTETQIDLGAATKINVKLNNNATNYFKSLLNTDSAANPSQFGRLTVTGGQFADEIRSNGNRGNVSIDSKGGDDKIVTFGGSVLVQAGDGNDTIICSGNGKATVLAGDGNDRIQFTKSAMGAGSAIYGGTGADTFQSTDGSTSDTDFLLNNLIQDFDGFEDQLKFGF